MKITKSRLKTIIMEEMRKINELDLTRPVPVGADLDDESGREDWWNEPYSASTKDLLSREASGGLERGYARNDYGTDIASFGQPTQAQLDASDYRARSGGGPEQSTAQMFAGMDMSGFPEANTDVQDLRARAQTVHSPRSTTRYTPTGRPGGLQVGPEFETGLAQDDPRSVPYSAAPTQFETATAAPITPDPTTFSGAGGYNYRELADGSFYFTGPDGKPGYAPKGSGAAVAIANQRAEMYGQQSRMAESRNALKNLVRMELKKSGII